VRVALAQINTTVGDVEGNVSRALGAVREARALGAGLVVLPELCVFGYPPKDLLLRRHMVERNLDGIRELAEQCPPEVEVLAGYVQPDPTGGGRGLYNAAALCFGGRVERWYAKTLLPTYDVFDESRYFNTGSEPCVYVSRAGDREESRVAGTRVAVTICEDLWNDEQFEGRRVYGIDPVQRAAAAGAEVLVNLSASPFSVGKECLRERIFGQQAREHGLSILFVNLVGGNDDLLFDGNSGVLDRSGRVVARAKAFAEDLLIVDLPLSGEGRVEPALEPIESVRRGLVMGTRDYVRKCGFGGVVLGLSGGIDSAVTAAIAVEAVGPAEVHAVALPSRYSSAHSLEDARETARTLGIDLRVIPIEDVHSALEATLADAFRGRVPDVTEENVQARIRGNILMALSNKFGWLLLTTGNKSELAVGYCTMYGDMCGGLAVISDVPKTMVYELARHINRTDGREMIPQRSITKAPSAELRDNQTDQDTLPPYDTLDAVLERHVERDASVEEIVARGFDRELVERVVRMVDANEYKRKQSAVGLRVTTRAFGSGRRMPIAARFR
jgi:NAD+ synthase/NAD+ synthase (glutamine-hydrolysing)